MEHEDTKTRILTAAKKLFQQKGYHAVTMRDVAGEARLSLGTLTYHYAKKQDLLYAIMDQNIEAFAQPPARNLREFDDLLERLLISIEVLPFYFNDPAVHDSFPELQRQHTHHVDAQHSRVEDSLLSLQAEGLLLDSLTEEELRQITRLFMFSHLGWTQHNASWPEESFIAREEIKAAQWLVLSPWLTEKGHREYDALAREKMNEKS